MFTEVSTGRIQKLNRTNGQVLVDVNCYPGSVLFTLGLGI